MREPLVITLGCRLNAYESEVMRRHASGAGLEDCVIVNTCAVTGEAVSQARQTIRKLRRERPDARIVVTGCAAQIEPEHFAEMPEVDHVIGNTEKMQADTFRGLAADADFERVAVNDIMSVKETALHMMDGFGTRARAYVQIQNGCDHRCTFCIIPLGRAALRARCRRARSSTEVRRLVEAGCGEVVLTGVDITSYGADLPGTMSLGRLIKQVLKHVPELQRLRLSSIDQVEVDPHLIDAIASEERLMPHLHLSVQAGDDMILEAHEAPPPARRCHPLLQRSSPPSPRRGVRRRSHCRLSRPRQKRCSTTRSALSTSAGSPTCMSSRSRRARARRRPACRRSRTRRSKSALSRLRAKGCETHAGFLDRLKGKKIEILMEGKNLGRTPHFAEVHVAPVSEIGSLKLALLGSHDGRRVDGMLVA